MSATKAEASEKIDILIEQIWKKYDTDGNGVLDLNEAEQFIRDTLKSTGQSKFKKLTQE